MTILYKALWQFYGWDSWFSGWLTAVLVPTENAWLMLMSNRKTRWQMSTIKCVHISRFALSTMQKQQEGGPSFRSITSLFKCVMLLKTMDWSTLTKWWNDLIKVYIPFGFTCERLPWPPPPKLLDWMYVSVQTRCILASEVYMRWREHFISEEEVPPSPNLSSHGE